MKYAVVTSSKHDMELEEFDDLEQAQRFYDNVAGRSTAEICDIYLMQVISTKSDGTGG